jgi:BMFP domain-containing protein YqiC
VFFLGPASLITIIDESQPERGPSCPVPLLRCVAPIAILANRPASGGFAMTQTSNRFFDEIGRLMNDAAGAAQGVKREVDTVVRNQAEKILRDLDIVKREEFEAVKDMARLAREENEALKLRIAALEAKLAGPSPGAPAPDVAI